MCNAWGYRSVFPEHSVHLAFVSSFLSYEWWLNHIQSSLYRISKKMVVGTIHTYKLNWKVTIFSLMSPTCWSKCASKLSNGVSADICQSNLSISSSNESVYNYELAVQNTIYVIARVDVDWCVVFCLYGPTNNLTTRWFGGKSRRSWSQTTKYKQTQ